MARVLVLRQGRFPWDVRVRREVEALLEAGHEVDVVCLHTPGEPRRERRGPLRVIRLPVPQSRSGALGYLLEYAAFALLSALVAARRRYDLVQVHTLPDSLVFSALIPKLRGARVLLDLHELMPEFFATKFGRQPRLIERVEQAAIRFADHTITCTPEMRDLFVARGADPARLDVVLNAADESIFHPRDVPAHDGFLLVSHGSLEERYGLDDLVDAVAQLDDLPDLRVRIFGDGAHRDALVARVAAQGVGDRVVLSDGWAPLDELLTSLAQADAGVVAMRKDAFRDRTQCNKTYDHVAMGKPVIHSRTDSTLAAFGEEAFAWYEAGDVTALASAIRAVHADANYRRRLVEAARERVAPLRWARQREHYLAVVRRVLARP